MWSAKQDSISHEGQLKRMLALEKKKKDRSQVHLILKIQPFPLLKEMACIETSKLP